MAEHNGHVCSICLNDFVKPKIIDCHHTYCLHCLQDYVKKSAKNNKFLCPLCRREIEIPKGGVTKFSANIYIEDVSVKKQVKTDIPTCDVCLKAQSQFRCIDCEQYMCESCKTTHDSLVGCRSHVVVSLNDKTDNKLRLETFCKKHKFAELEFYCMNCQTSICMKCLMAKHKDHNTPDLKDLTEEIRKLLDQTKKKMEGNLIKLKSELETIQCKISNERKTAKDSSEIVDHICVDLINTRGEVKNKIEEIHQNNVMKLKKFEILKANAIRGLETSLSHTGDVLKNQSIEEMLKISRDMMSIQQMEETDRNFTLPNLQLYCLDAAEKVTRPISSLVYGSVIYFDTNGKTRDQKQYHTSTGWDKICRFIYYYYRLMCYYYLMYYPFIFPLYLSFLISTVPLCVFLWLLITRLLQGPTIFVGVVKAYDRVTQEFNFCICNIFSNTEGFEVSFSNDVYYFGMLSVRSPDYERYGHPWHIYVSSDRQTVELRMHTRYRDCYDRTLFGVKIVDADGHEKFLTEIANDCWKCAIDLKNLRSDMFKIQIVIFEKNDFIYR